MASLSRRLASGNSYKYHLSLSKRLDSSDHGTLLTSPLEFWEMESLGFGQGFDYSQYPKVHLQVYDKEDLDDDVRRSS